MNERTAPGTPFGDTSWPLPAQPGFGPPQGYAPEPKRTWGAGRVLAAFASPSFFIVVIAFFLPWYAVSCGGYKVASGSGMDMATHGLKQDSPMGLLTGSPFGGGSGAFSSIFGGGGTATPPAATGSPWGTLPGTPATFPFSATMAPARETTPWVFAVPVLALAALVLALASALARPGRGRLTGISAAAAGIAAAGVQILHSVAVHARLDEAMSSAASLPPGSTPLGSGLASAGATMIRSAVTIDLEVGWILSLLFCLLAAALAGLGAFLGRTQ
jgi:hypothetical protein